jgi:hypothetical protein
VIDPGFASTINPAFESQGIALAIRAKVALAGEKKSGFDSQFGSRIFSSMPLREYNSENIKPKFNDWDEPCDCACRVQTDTCSRPLSIHTTGSVCTA